VAAYRNLGGVIDKDVIAKAKELDDQWNKLTRSIGDSFKSAVITAVEWLQYFDAQIELIVAKSARFLRDDFGADVSDLDARIAKAEARLAGAKPPADGGTVFGKSGRKVVIPDGKADAAASRESAQREREILRIKEQAEQQALRAFERRQDVIEQLQFEAQQLGRTTEMQRVYNNLRAAGVTLDSADGQRIQALVMHQATLEKLKDAQDAYNDSLMSMAELGVSAFDRMISGGEKLTDILRDVAKQLASAATRALLLGQGPLSGLFGTAGGGGGLLGSLIPRSGGGPVSPNRAYQVGERGPELFVPQSAGKIVPNHAMRGGGGMSVQIINQSSARVEPAGTGMDAKGNPFQRLLVRDTVRSEMPGGFKGIAAAYGQNPVLKRR
jgi:hypothetical protein